MKSSFEILSGRGTHFIWFQLIVVYFLIECALWSSSVTASRRWSWAAAIVVLIFVLAGHPSLRALGLSVPTTLGTSVVLAAGAAAAMLLLAIVLWGGGEIPANPNLRPSWPYFLWALVQEFLLQSFFFTRCEELFGSPAAVWVAGTLFALAHLPSPVLTTFTLMAALFFCEMFRRYRSIYPIAIVHGVLGMTVAVTVPDNLLHHMRVGIGYLRY